MEKTLLNERHHGRITIPCIGFCVVLFLILGILPVLTSSITQVLRPTVIALCLVFRARYLHRYSVSWKNMIVFMFYYFFVFLFHPITKSTILSFASLELFSLFFLFMVQRPWSEKEIDLILQVAALASAFFAVVIFRDNPNFLHEKSYDGIHYFSTTVNDNTAAFSIVPGALCGLLLSLFQKPGTSFLKRLFFFVCAGVCFVCLFSIGARSAFFSALIGACLIILEWINVSVNFRNRNAYRIALLLLVVLVFVIGKQITEGTHSARLFDLATLTDGTGRDSLADQAWAMIRKKPIFGGGFDYWAQEQGDPLGTHNTFLTHMVQGGFTAALILALFIVSSIRELFRYKSLIPFAFLAEMIAHTFTESDLNYYAYVPLIIAFIIARNTLPSNRKGSTPRFGQTPT